MFVNLVIILLFTGCVNTKDLANVGRVPDFAETTLPLQKSDPSHKWQIPMTEKSVALRNNNSLWSSSKEPFRNRKVRSIGDILTIKINIKDNANLDNSTSHSRQEKDNLSAPNFFGYDTFAKHFLPRGFDLKNLLNINGANSHNGTGKIQRKENIQTEIAALVSEILENGSLVITATQEVRVNSELRAITLSGVVRPGDIAADNSIGLEQVAGARLSYGGRGDITRVQKTPYGKEIIGILSPF